MQKKTLSMVSMIINASAWITHMDHTLHNQCMQHWLCFRIRNPSSNDLVNVITIPWLVLILYPNQDMSMRKTMLLKLNDMDTCNGVSKERFLMQVLKESMQLLIEDSANNVRSLRSLLARLKSSLNFWPLRISSYGHKV